MAMRRLSSLVLRKWKEKERWTGRRRSEPYAGGNEEEEGEETKRENRDRLTYGRMMRRKSEPCGATEEDQTEEKKKSGARRERRTCEPSVEEEAVRRDRRRAEPGRGRERRKSTSWLMAEDRAAGQADGTKPRRRSEPCGVLHVQLLPVSGRRRRELLQRRTGRRASCSEEEERHMTRGRSDPAGPLDYSKQNTARGLSTRPPTRAPPAAALHLLLDPGGLRCAGAALRRSGLGQSVQSCRRRRRLVRSGPLCGSVRAANGVEG